MSAQLQTLSLSRLSRLRRQEIVERHMLRLIILGLVVLSLAGLLYLTQASAVTTTTYEIQELQQKKERLQRRRDRLRADIAALTRPERVKARAEELGFRPADPSEFLAVSKVPVVAQAPPISPEKQPHSAAESFLMRVSTWLQASASVFPAPQQVEAGSAER